MEFHDTNIAQIFWERLWEPLAGNSRVSMFHVNIHALAHGVSFLSHNAWDDYPRDYLVYYWCLAPLFSI